MAKICNINFWIENEPPPPSELFRKFIRFGGGRLPLPGSGKNVPSLLLIKNSLREFSTMFATADTNRNGRIDFDE